MVSHSYHAQKASRSSYVEKALSLGVPSDNDSSASTASSDDDDHDHDHVEDQHDNVLRTTEGDDRFVEEPSDDDDDDDVRRELAAKYAVVREDHARSSAEVFELRSRLRRERRKRRLEKRALRDEIRTLRDSASTSVSAGSADDRGSEKRRSSVHASSSSTANCSSTTTSSHTDDVELGTNDVLIAEVLSLKLMLAKSRSEADWTGLRLRRATSERDSLRERVADLEKQRSCWRPRHARAKRTG